MNLKQAIITTGALVGGSTAVAVVGTGLGVVGAFGAVGIGTLEIFGCGALAGAFGAHKATKSFDKKPQQADWAKSTTTASGFKSTNDIAREINDMRNGRF